MPSEILQVLKKSWVAGQRLRITRGTAGEAAGGGNDSGDHGARPPRRGGKPPHHGKPGGPPKGKPRKHT
jgi:hypothetical protein